MHWAIRSSQWLLMLQAIRMVLAFTLGAWMARALGPEQYGVWGTAVAWSGVTACFAELGLRQLVLRIIGQRPRLTHVVAGTAFRLWTMLGSLCVCLLSLVNLATGTTIPWQVLFAVASPYLLSGFVIHHVILEANQQSHISARNGMIAAMVSAAIRLAALIWMPTLVALTWSVASDMIIVFVLAAFTGKKSAQGWVPTSWNNVIAVYMLKRGFSLVMSLVGLVIMLRLSVILLERLQGHEEAGIYNAATRLSELCYFICPMFSTLFLPKLSKFIRHDPPRFYQLALQSSQLMTLIAYGVIGGLILFGTWAIHLLFGEEYARSAEVLKIHALACLPYFFLEWRYQLLVAMDQTRLNAILLWFGVVVHFITSALLIPQYGAIGSAWASLITYVLCGPLICFVIPHLRWMAFTQIKALFFPVTVLISPIQSWNKLQGLIHRQPSQTNGVSG